MQDDSVIDFEKPQEDPLTELIRSGAQQLLERAIQAELAELRSGPRNLNNLIRCGRLA